MNLDTRIAMMTRCPTCGSNHPHLHPAVQVEGEVEICGDEFHLRQTPQNLPAYIEMVVAKRGAKASVAKHT